MEKGGPDPSGSWPDHFLKMKGRRAGGRGGVELGASAFLSPLAAVFHPYAVPPAPDTHTRPYSSHSASQALAHQSYTSVLLKLSSPAAPGVPRSTERTSFGALCAERLGLCID